MVFHIGWLVSTQKEMDKSEPFSTFDYFFSLDENQNIIFFSIGFTRLRNKRHNICRMAILLMSK